MLRQSVPSRAWQVEGGPLCRQKSSMRLRWQIALSEVEDNSTKTKRFTAQLRSPLSRRQATFRRTPVESTRKGTSCEFLSPVFCHVSPEVCTISRTRTSIRQAAGSRLDLTTPHHIFSRSGLCLQKTCALFFFVMTASATEGPTKCARSCTRATPEIRVALETGPRRAHRAPTHQPHHSSPIQLPSQPPGLRPPSPPHCQPTSVFWVSAILEFLEYSSAAPHRKPFHPLCRRDTASSLRQQELRSHRPEGRTLALERSVQ